MSKYDLILNEIAPKFGDQLKPLICIVVPRISENCLLITISERFSERYVSRIISLDRFLVSANRDLLVAEIQAAFNLRDENLLGSFKK